MSEAGHRQVSAVIIGAGPAGLTAAYRLLKEGGPQTRVVVVEADPVYVGGLSRTVKYKGFHFDIGGHRFFSKSAEVESLWTELLPDDMMERSRSSRIFYRGQFFSYPLSALEALFKLGCLESARCLLSYFKARVLPVRRPRSFEDWVSNQFGKRLFTIFFKAYTEKVWGMDCREISADWAAQRIKGLSLFSAIKDAALPRRRPRSRGRVIKSLITSFRYPRKGPGMMWEACADRVRKMGGEVVMGHRVTGCTWAGEKGEWSVLCRGADGKELTIHARHLLSSAPLSQLARALSPRLSPEALKAAESLKYRDFLVVAVVVAGASLFEDNWIYVHDPRVKVGRIQNFEAWSPEMVPDPALGCYGLEYFCFENDELWSASDAELIELAKRELATIGLAAPGAVLDGCVVRQRKAYPVYDDDYLAHVRTLREEMSDRFPTLHVMGRNGMHKYNNQDHAMMTAVLCAKNVLAGARLYDVWSVNQDAEYLEAGAVDEGAHGSGIRAVPTRIKDAAVLAKTVPPLPGKGSSGAGGL